MLILATGFFVAGEFALVTVERSRIEHMAEEGHRGARSVLKGLRTLSFQLSGAQLGITVTSLLVGFIAEPTLGRVLKPLVEAVGLPDRAALGVSVALALALATAASMVIGELMPKNLAIARSLGLAFTVVTPLRIFNALLKPLIVFLNSSANLTVRLLGIRPRGELVGVRSLHELGLLIESSRRAGALAAEEYALLSRSVSFGDKAAGDSLVPRVNIVSLPATATLADLCTAALESGHSRLPVVGENLDDVRGIAHVKDSYVYPLEERASVPITRVMQEAFVVPESRGLNDLLADMRRNRVHLAIVADEFGGTAGIVTLEDLLEEIVGDIEDEYDLFEPVRLASPAGVNVLPGMLHPDEVLAASGFEMPEGDWDTLAGFLLALFDRIPAQGDHLSHEGWEFKVTKMDRHRIAEVLLVGPPSPPDLEDGG